METIINFISSIVFFNVLGVFGVDSLNLPFAIFVILVGYVFIAVKLNGVQFTRFGTCLRYTFGKQKKDETKSDNGEDEKIASPLKTLFTSIASCTGTNATAGVVFMVAVGGPGVVFWIPLIALFSMSFRLCEVYLSHHYRAEHIDNNSFGGPFDYIKKGLASLGFAKLGIVLTMMYTIIMLSGGAIGVSMYEANQFVVVLEKGFDFLNGKRWLISVTLTILVFIIIIGGTKRVSNVLGTILPVVSLVYVFTCFIIIIANYDKLGDAVKLIVSDAFHPTTIAGGAVASFCMALRKTALSHETGLGTSGIVHAMSDEKDSMKEAIRSMMTPIINSIIICMSSAFVVILTGVYKTDAAKDGMVALTNAFGSLSGCLSWVVIIVATLLTFNVLVGWSNYIAKCVSYITAKKWVYYVVLAVFLCCTFIGGVKDDFYLIMNLVDASVVLLAIINVPVIIALSGQVRKAIKEYDFKNKKSGSK